MKITKLPAAYPDHPVTVLATAFIIAILYPNNLITLRGFLSASFFLDQQHGRR